MIWCSSTFSRSSGARRPLGDDVPEVPLGHVEGDIDVDVLVRNLDVAGLPALALDDADHLELVAPDAQGLADRALRRQQLAGAELGQHGHGGALVLVAPEE